MIPNKVRESEKKRENYQQKRVKSELSHSQYWHWICLYDS